MMTAVDEYDIRASFDAMDEDRVGEITFDEFYTALFLGLFDDPQLTPTQLHQLVQEATGITATPEFSNLSTTRITIDMALQTLSKVCWTKPNVVHTILEMKAVWN
jgi:hypothetical protein